MTGLVEGEQIEFPKFNVDEVREEKMRIYLTILIDDNIGVDDYNNIQYDTKDLKLANNYIEAVESAYLKINEYGLDYYLHQKPSSEWEVKKRSYHFTD